MCRYMDATGPVAVSPPMPCTSISIDISSKVEESPTNIRVKDSAKVLQENSTSTTSISLRDKIVKVVKQGDAWIERNTNFCLPLQKKIDAFAQSIKDQFSKITLFNKFNSWLNEKNGGNWIEQFAQFLLKLVPRAARNIFGLVYKIIETIFYSLVHPYKALKALGELLVQLIKELAKPETWSKIGAGMMGASLGQALVTGNPIAAITLIIGGAMVFVGLTYGAIKSIYDGDDWEKFSAKIFSQIKDLPEAMLTGFIMGLLFGPIERAVQQRKLDYHQVDVHDRASAQVWADRYAEFSNTSRLRVDFYSNYGFDKGQFLAFSDKSNWGYWINSKNFYNFSMFQNKAFAHAGAALGGGVAMKPNLSTVS